MSHQLKSKHWCFTINNPTESDAERLRSIGGMGDDDSPGSSGGDGLRSGVQYIVWGEEVGDSGTPHFQGFISFVNRKVFGGVRQVLPTGAHIERARGTPQEAAEYCKKDGHFYEAGVVPAGRGRRTDLDAAIDTIRDGARVREVAREHPHEFVKYPRGLSALVSFYTEPFVPPRQVFAFVGAAGAGKTRAVHALESDLFVHGGDRWFDGYEGQEAALIDDFDGTSLTRDMLLRILDQYPMKVPVKGAFVEWVPKRVYVTSNLDLHDWFKIDNIDQRDALDRRFHVIKRFTKSAAGSFDVTVEREGEPVGFE